MAALKTLFDEVKRTYFPRWDLANEWRVRRKTTFTGHFKVRAMCNSKTETIEVSRTFTAKDENEYRGLLAHEICHAVASPYHGKKWQTRFFKVADKAKHLKHETLAAMIYKDIKLYRESMKPSLTAIQQNIEDALNDNPNASFEEVIEWVANNWSFTSDGLLRRYITLEKFFERAKKAALCEKKLSKEHEMLSRNQWQR